jgi:hypothetical protein
MPLGQSFAPTDRNLTERRGPSQAPIQEAIRVLSLQMPRVVGASSPSPAALLAGQPGVGGGGIGGPTSNPIIEQLLRALMAGGLGQNGPAMGDSGIPGLPGAPPAPRAPVLPGFTWTQPPQAPPPQQHTGGGESMRPPMFDNAFGNL